MEYEQTKKIVRKINSIVYRQWHQQFLLNLTRTECNIDYILRLTEEIKESGLLIIAIRCAVRDSRRWLDYLEYQLSTMEEKEIIPDEIVTHHRKQIQQFRRYYADIDSINREWGKNEYV